MSNNNALKTYINNTIYENNTQQITGAIMNTVLNSIVNTLGAGYQFAGVADVSMNPSEPDARVFYLASAGIYTNFGGIEVPQNKLGVLKWDTSWHLETIDGLGGGSNLTGYISVPSVSELPEVGQPTLGYLIGTNLYLYVGEGGDTADGKYQNCGPFRGPQGNEGGDGVGITDISQIEQSYENGGINIVRITTTDGNHYDVNIRNGKSSAGLFPDVATLNSQRPNPSVGEYAFVGSGFPAELYVCNTEGTWTDSGEDYDGDNVDLTDYATKAEVNQLEAKVDGNLMSARAKNALLAVFQKVAYAVPDVSAELTELENALFNLDEIIGIEAVFNQIETVYDQGISSLDDLREELVVKAVYGDNTKVAILGYSLSGDISVAGTDTITVSYLGFTDTFDVVVTHYTTQMVFSIGNGDITKYQGSSGRYNNSTKYGISNFNNSTNRRVFLAETGDVPLRKTENGNSIGKYPIPIPRNASKVTVSVTPNTTKVAGGVLKLRDGYYPNDTGTGFLEFAVGTQEYAFSAEQKEWIRKGYGFFYGSGSTVSGNYSSSNEPTEFIITFE